jgi:hypothetical protein
LLERRMKIKPWQVAVIVIGILVGVGSAVYQLITPSGPRLPDSMLLIDVESGQVYRANTRGRSVMLPARRPDTGKIALLRLRTDDEGKHYVSGRDLSLLQYLDQGVEVKAINPESGDVIQASKDIKTYEEPK